MSDVDQSQLPGAETINPEDVIEVFLSQEELAYIMEVLEIGGMIGFDVPEDFDNSARQVAHHSLVARGLAGPDDYGNFAIDETLVSIVVAASAFVHALNIKTSGPDFPGIEDQWFYFIPGVIVHHNKPRPGIEAFRTVPTGTLVTLLLSTALNIEFQDESVPDGAAFTVEKSIIGEAARLRATQGSEAAQAYLVAQNLPGSFARDIIYPVSQSDIAAFSAHFPQTEQDELTFTARGLALYRAQQGCWLLKGIGDDSPTLEVVPSDGLTAFQSVSKFMAAALAQ